MLLSQAPYWKTVLCAKEGLSVMRKIQLLRSLVVRLPICQSGDNGISLIRWGIKWDETQMFSISPVMQGTYSMRLAQSILPAKWTQVEKGVAGNRTRRRNVRTLAGAGGCLWQPVCLWGSQTSMTAFDGTSVHSDDWIQSLGRSVLGPYFPMVRWSTKMSKCPKVKSDRKG